MFESWFGSEDSSQLVDAATRDFTRMLHDSRHMLELALGQLLENAELDVDLDRLDDRVDRGEQMVRRTVLEHLSFNPKHQLVASLVLVSTVQDGERIGDLARGVGDLAKLAHGPRTGPFAEDLLALGRRLLPLFESCAASFQSGDRARAEEVVAAMVGLKEDFHAYTRRLAESDLGADLAVVYATAAQLLRRIASHLSNIASAVTQPFDRIRHGDEDP